MKTSTKSAAARSFWFDRTAKARWPGFAAESAFEQDERHFEKSPHLLGFLPLSDRREDLAFNTPGTALCEKTTA